MSPTGEQPIAKEESALSESTPVKIGLVIVLLGAAISVGGLYVKVDMLQDRVSKGEAERALLAAKVVTLDKESATKADIALLTKSNNDLIIEVRTFIASFGGTRTNNANYRPRPQP